MVIGIPEGLQGLALPAAELDSYCIVLSVGTWDECQAHWYKLDNARVANVAAGHRGTYRGYSVRNTDDPRWLALLESQTVRVRQHPGRKYNLASDRRQRQRDRAARAFLKARRATSEGGGWFYVQGWGYVQGLWNVYTQAKRDGYIMQHGDDLIVLTGKAEASVLGILLPAL
jgi:hypothetical protein